MLLEFLSCCGYEKASDVFRPGVITTLINVSLYSERIMLAMVKSERCVTKTMTSERTHVREGVLRDFILGVEWSDGPDDGLTAVRSDVNIQLVLRLQGSLVRYNGVAVHHSSIEEPYAARILLLT